MMSISTRSITGWPSARARPSTSSASRPLRAISTRTPVGSRMLDNANTLRTSSSTTSTVRPSSAESRLRASSSI
ncbi:hypothetical protein G6F31_020542 [Rhizopus arrhizus]|nr:hypothetical protein G6F31_020542 [Rhizopus arrhizus]